MEYPELVLSNPMSATVAHEIAHQWWYRIVGNDQYTEPWLDESFAEFSQARLPDSAGGPDRLRYCSQLPNPPRAPLTATMRTFSRSTNIYAEVAYVGGACTLTTLAGELGRERFDRMIRGLVDTYRWGVITTADFIRALREAAPSGFDVDAFLREARIETG
jgi:aminopeptidase N